MTTDTKTIFYDSYFKRSLKILSDHTLALMIADIVSWAKDNNRNEVDEYCNLLLDEWSNRKANHNEQEP